MRVVIDTNVLVSALLHPGRVPDQALTALHVHRGVVVHDPRIVAEYRAVLARPKFAAVAPSAADALLARLCAHGEALDTVAPWAGDMTDPDDRAFVEVALAGRADALVTGNVRHFPSTLAFAVLTPAALLAALTAP